MEALQKQITQKMTELICPPEGILVTGGKQLKEGNQYPNEKQIDLTQHVTGSATYALDTAYTDFSGMKVCKWGAIDVDEKGETGLHKALAIRDHFESNGIHALTAFSGRKGYHVYVITEPVPEEIMKRALSKVKTKIPFEGETIPGAGHRCKPAPCLHQVAGSMSYLFRETPYEESNDLNNLPEGFYEDQLSILHEIAPTPANVLVMYATKEQSAQDTGDLQNMIPGFSQGEKSLPPCISQLIATGGAASLGTYDKNNLSLATFCCSKGLEETESMELAKELAENAEKGPVETGKDFDAKIKHFKSALSTPSVNDTPFNCTFMLKAKKELQFDCRKCAGKPEGMKTSPSKSGIDQNEDLQLEISIAEDLVTYIIQEGKAYEEIAPEIMPPLPYRCALKKIKGGRLFVYTLLLRALNDGAVTEASLANWIDMNLSQEAQFFAYFNPAFTHEWEHLPTALFNEFRNKVLNRFRAMKTGGLIDEDTFKENFERAADLSTRFRIWEQIMKLDEESRDRSKDIHTTSADCTHEVGRILSSSQQGAVESVTSKAIELMEYITGEGVGRVPTPFPAFNDLIGGGFANGCVYDLVSPPGGGKSTISKQFADYSASLEIPTIFISMEMSKEQLFVNSIAREAEINSSKIMSPYNNIKESVMDQVGEVAGQYFQTVGNYLYVIEGGYETSPARIGTMASQIRAELNISKKDPFLVVIDYLQLLNTGIEALDTGPNETQKISELAVKAKQLARDTNVAILALSDVTKEEQKNSNENKELTLNSLRGSNRIGHAADSVIALYSESAQSDGGKAKTDPWDMYTEKVSSSENARDFLNSIKEAKKDNSIGGDGATVYSRMELIKNRAGQGRGNQFLLYHRAYHKFDPVTLDGQEKAEGRA